jgi:Thioesterase-like superfamily
MMSLQAVFVRDGTHFEATELARGPWDPRACHGGASAALLVHAFERCSPQPGLRLARITFEFMRPVPVGRLTVTAEVTRPGRRVMLLEGSIRDGNGAEVARARALRVGPSELGEPPAVRPPFASPERGRPNDFGDEDGPMFTNAALDIRFVEGAFRRLGPATAWFRLRGPIVAGEPPSPFELLAAAGDFGNGIATTLSWEEHMFINPDLTLYLEREPRGEWVALQAEMRVALGNVAIAESLLWDREGRVGRATQALVVGPR